MHSTGLRFAQFKKLCKPLGYLGDKGDENGEWRSPHNEKLHSLHRSLNIVRLFKSRILRCAGDVIRTGDRSAFKPLTSKSIGKRPLGREDNIRMYLKEIGVNTNWVDLAHDRDYFRDVVDVAKVP